MIQAAGGWDAQQELDTIVWALHGHRAGTGWMALCPAHDDRSPSLSLSIREGRLLWYCHAGCTQDAVRRALTQRSLLGGRDAAPLQLRKPARSPRPSRSLHSTPVGTWECVYVYTDADHQPVHRTVRFRDPKSFRQQRWEEGRWRWGLGNVRTVLYRLPDILTAPPEALIWIAEGERDADRLADLGLRATCVPHNAWRDHYAEWLRGRHVVLLEDNDPAGRAHVEAWNHALRGIAATRRLLSFPALPLHGDVSDWLDAGGTVAELVARATGPDAYRDAS